MRRLVDVLAVVAGIGATIITVRSFTSSEEAPSPVETQPVPAAEAPPPPKKEWTPEEIEAVKEAARRFQEERIAANKRAALEAARRNKGNRLNPGDFSDELDLPPTAGLGGPGLPEKEFGRRERGSAASPSPLESERREARRKLEALFPRLRSDARTLIAEAVRHQSGCGLETQGPCGNSLRRIGEKAVSIGRRLDYAQELTRKSWLPPGEVRKLRKRYGLQDGLWDELVRTVQRYRYR